MEHFCSCIENQTVYPILIKNNGNRYFTLYYYTERSDSVLHKETKSILYFPSTEHMEDFCKKNDLQIASEVAEYDFEEPMENPIDYQRVLHNWNLLNTIANALNMSFEGDGKKYNSLYELLFRLNTSGEPIPPTYQLCEKNYKYILKVFRKKDRFLNRFELYSKK